MRKKDGNVGLSRLCFFARSSELSIRRRSQDSHTPGSPSPSSIDASMLLLDWCSPSFHRHDYINQKARRTLFLSRLISLCLLPLLPLLLLLFSSVRWRGYALSNRWMTDENVLNTEQDEHSIVVFDEKGESGRTSTCTPSFSIDETPFFPFLPPPLCIPLVLRVLFGSERVQGVPASDSFVVEAVISVHTRAWKCFVSRLGFWILWIVSTVLRWMYEDLFHSKNWRLLEKRRTSVD